MALTLKLWEILNPNIPEPELQRKKKNSPCSIMTKLTFENGNPLVPPKAGVGSQFSIIKINIVAKPDINV